MTRRSCCVFFVFSKKCYINSIPPKLEILVYMSSRIINDISKFIIIKFGGILKHRLLIFDMFHFPRKPNSSILIDLFHFVSLISRHYHVKVLIIGVCLTGESYRPRSRCYEFFCLIFSLVKIFAKFCF